ncbi:MAG TPA: energy transducer TonB, partial [Candidatus Acidoferrales bacterium]|nr:energy transducer TonB [Candidatus Acidoferrales bacterium]
MSVNIPRARIALVIVLLAAAAPPGAAQHTEIQVLASRLAGELSKAGTKRVAVADYVGPQEGVTSLGKAVSLEFAASLAWSGGAFDVSHSAALQAALREAGAAPKNTDIFDDRVVKRFGELSGADVVVTGILGVASDHVEVSVRAVNAATGQTLAQATGNLPLTTMVKDLLARRFVPVVGAGTLPPSYHDGAYEPGRNGITRPTCVSCPNPSYTDAARAAKIRGMIVLRFVVLEDGTPSRISIVRGLGYGLDEEATRTLASWRFKPATDASGKPVPVWM